MMTRAEQSRKWRAKNPTRAAFIILKFNAKRRGIPFEITYDYFRQFAFKTKLITSKGREADSMSVDRINNDVGYVEGNLQVMSLSDNGYKGYLEREIYYVEGTGLKSKIHKPDEQAYPF